TVSIPTGADIAATPSPFSLETNRPNPFDRNTRIRFSLPAAGAHKLVVYDVNGRRVRVLSEGARAAGIGEVEWDGRDGSGAPVPSGVYFYRLETASGN